MTEYHVLANAIIEQAAKDYLKAAGAGNEETIAEIETFFHSVWFSRLTGLDGSYILRELRNITGKS